MAIYILRKPFGELFCPVAGGGAIYEQTTPIGIELFHHEIKMIHEKDLQ